MPIEYTVHQDGLFVNAVATGVITTELVLEHIRTLKKDTRLRSGYKFLFDEHAIQESRVNDEGLQKIVEEIMADPRLSYSKLAIVAGQGTSFDRARLLKILTDQENQSVIVFHNLSAAKKWIGLPESSD